MKYTLEIEIALPRSKVIELFDNPDNWPKWKESFVSAEQLSGTTREVGAKTELIHKFGNRDTEMVKTIESK